MLGDREELDVGESEVREVTSESRRDLPVGERAIALLRLARPRSEVALVDRHRLARQVAPRALRHPRLVTPLVAVESLHDRRRARRLLELEGERIGLEARQSLTRQDLELVERPFVDVGDEDLEHARRAE